MEGNRCWTKFTIDLNKVIIRVGYIFPPEGSGKTRQ